MQELKFVRTENGSLIVTDEVGEFYQVLVDDAVLSGIRQLARGEHPSKASPKEIQSLIRSGKSAAEVAELTGAELADVERFEVPVVAEREFVLENALRVTVVTDHSENHSNATTFGAAMHSRLEGLSAQRIAWSAWRDDAEGWLVSCEFTSHDVGHLAVWSFDHKKSVLAPHNDDATTLSKQGVIGDRLIPKLRAVEVTENAERFDSGAFRPDIASATPVDTEVVEPLRHEHIEVSESAFESPDAETARRVSVEELAVTRDEEPVDFGQTADLLDALRRRRGERDSGPQPVLPNEHVSTDTRPSLAEIDDLGATQPLIEEPSESEKVTGKRGRQGVPSWDDILFGTRSDEDPA